MYKTIGKILTEKAAGWTFHDLSRHLFHGLSLSVSPATLLSALALTAVITLLGSCSSHHSGSKRPSIETVAHVDLERYGGLWYEIGRYPNSFQKGCQESTAMYTVHPDGEMEVVNSCRDEKDGRWREARGRAWVVDENSNARLKVSFFWPFRGDYWIIDLGRDYEYAVVGTPSRRYLWILSRTPLMQPYKLEEILQKVERQGFVRDSLLLRQGEKAL